MTERRTLVRRRSDPALAGRLQGSVSPWMGAIARLFDVPESIVNAPGDIYNAEDQAATSLRPCPAEGCDLFGPHELHEDAEGFRWHQDEQAERAWKP
jgi:hypothetical protein